MTQVVAHYNLLERIGSGGLGEVFRARDTERGRTVALKMLPPEFAVDPARRERFMQETRDAACLSHPAIATLVESGEADGRLYLVIEFVEGQTLTRALSGGPMPPRQAVAIAIQVADALAEGHAAGIIHRDLKPDNIMVTPKGAAKVLDFGLAGWTTGGMAREMVTTQGEAPPTVVLGTVAFMSPEQALGQKVDARSDIFSLGIVLYQMLTARNPFAAPSAGTTLINLLQVNPQKPSAIASDVPARLDEIVARALSKDVQKRYETAAELAADLRGVFGDRTQIVDAPAAEAPEAVVVAATPPSRRGRLVALLALLAIVLGGAGAAYVYRPAIESWSRHRFGPPPAPVIAVIPLSEAGEQDTSFADALTDDLIVRLGQTPGLRVLGRSAVRSSRGRAPADVAREVGAAVVLTGAITREAGDVKIGLELVDAADGVRFWQQEFVNGGGALISAQAQMATSIAEALKLSPVPNASRERSLSRSVSPDAYGLYARGRAALVAGDLDRAVQLFDRAILLDGGLAEAYAGLARALHDRAQRSGAGMQDQAMQARVRDAATRAAAIDPDLADVEVAQALAATTIPDSVRHLVRAATLDPTDAQVYHSLADDLAVIDPARALSLYERSRVLDPRLAANHADMVSLLLARGDRAQAVQAAAAFNRLAPRSEWLPAIDSTLAAADQAKSVEILNAARATLPPVGVLSLARALYAADRRDQAAALLQQLVAGHPEFCEAKATYAGVLFESKRVPDAQAIADPIIATGPAPCAATAAAALADPKGTAVAVRRIASEPPALHDWLQSEYGINGEYTIAARRYPWPKVIDHAEVVAAVTELRTAYARVKVATDKELKLLPR